MSFKQYCFALVFVLSGCKTVDLATEAGLSSVNESFVADFTNTFLINGLGLAILKVYEEELIANPEKVDQSLFEKNQSLIVAIEQELATDPIKP